PCRGRGRPPAPARAPRRAAPRGSARWRSGRGSRLIAERIGELRGGAPQKRRDLATALAREAVRGRGDREGRDRRADRSDRDGDAAHAVVELLVVDRVTALANLVERAPQRRPVDQRARRVAAQLEAVEERVAPRGWQRGEQGLAGAGRVERDASAHAREE